MNELSLISFVLPILVLLVVGRFIIWRKFLNSSDARVLSKLFLYIFFPSLILGLLPQEDFKTLWDFRYVLASLILIIFLYGGTLMIHTSVLRRSLDASALAAYAETKFSAGILGVPVLLQMIGHHSIVPTAINLMTGYFIVNPVTFFLLDLSSEKAQGNHSTNQLVLKTLRNSITNPIIVATFIGLCLSAGSIQLPQWSQNTLQTLGGATTPAALLAVGMTLNVSNLKDNFREIFWMSGVRVILSPAIAIILAQWLNLSPVIAIALVISFGLPTSQLLLPIAEQYEIYEESSAGITTLTTLMFMITWPVTVWLCTLLWPGIIHNISS